MKPRTAPIVGTWWKIVQARSGSTNKIEVMETTLTTQIFLKALIPNMYPAIKIPPARVINKNIFKNVCQNGCEVR